MPSASPRWIVGIIIGVDWLALSVTSFTAIRVSDRLATDAQLLSSEAATSCLMGLVWVVLLGITGHYPLDGMPTSTTVYRTVFVAAFYSVAVYVLASFVLQLTLPRTLVVLQALLNTLVAIASSWGWRNWLSRSSVRLGTARPVVVFGDPGQASRLLQDLSSGELPSFVWNQPTASMPILTKLSTVVHQLEMLQRPVLVIAESQPTALHVLSEVRTLTLGRDIQFIVPLDLYVRSIDLDGQLLGDGVPYVLLRNPGLTMAARFTKKVMDLVLGLLLMTVLLPIGVVVAMLISLRDGQPVFYTQRRAGKYGKPFRMLKFRTMTMNADDQKPQPVPEKGGTPSPGFKIENDPRITTLGRRLRRWSLDEIPQIINVLRGQMSLVGPRPHPFDEIERYSLLDFERLSVKPGVTGLWQVSGRSNLTWQQQITLDREYVRHWSLSQDLAILLRTVGAVVLRKGAY